MAKGRLDAGARLRASASQFSSILAGPILQKGAFSLGCAVAQDKLGSAWLEFCSRKKGYGLATNKLRAGSKKVALGTVGRIVTTLGERLGKQKLVPAQGVGGIGGGRGDRHSRIYRLPGEHHACGDRRHFRNDGGIGRRAPASTAWQIARPGS